jgi:hypothetical protein
MGIDRIKPHLPLKVAHGSMSAMLLVRISSHSRSLLRVENGLSLVEVASSTSTLVRCISSSSCSMMQPNLHTVKAAQAIDPPPYAHLASLGNTTTGESPSYPSQNLYDASKAARVLGIGAETPYVTIAESTRDCLTDFKTRGWQP